MFFAQTRGLEMKWILILVVLVYSVTAGVFWVTAVSQITIYAAIDSYSWESVPDANNGGSDNFAITSFASNPKNMRGWIAFNIQEIPSNVWIVNAKLHLRIWHKTTASEGGDTTGRIYGTYRLTQPWEEFSVNWANQPNYTEEHRATSPVPPGQGGWDGPVLYMDWDITDIVRDWLSGKANYGVMIRDAQEDAPVQYTTQFFQNSNKTPDSSYHPQLIVTYVNPESVAALLAVFVAEGLFITFRWRKKTARAGS